MTWYCSNCHRELLQCDDTKRFACIHCGYVEEYYEG